MSKRSFLTRAGMVVATGALACAVVPSAFAASDWAMGFDLQSEDAGVGTILYAEEYFDGEGIVNPATAEAYTADELDAIEADAEAGADGYVTDVPEGAVLGMTVYGDDDTVFWFDADAAEAIVSHADPLVLNALTGKLYTADGELVADAMGSAWAVAFDLQSEDAGVGTILYAEEYFDGEGIVNPATAEAYTDDELAAVFAGAEDPDAEGYVVNVPFGAVIGMTVYGNDDEAFWYDADAAEAIVSHADPLVLDAETGDLTTADGELVAEAMVIDDEAAAGTYADGTYEAEGKGIGGKVPVTVTIEGGVITAVEVGDNSETQGIGSKAIEQLPELIVAANGTDGVDGVSGASVTSKAIFTAVEDCLEQASA
jgi:uncharacterized protein with FMN-binding domain